MKVNTRNNVYPYLKRYVQQNKNYEYVITNFTTNTYVTFTIRYANNQQIAFTFAIKKEDFLQIEKAKRVYARKLSL